MAAAIHCSRREVRPEEPRLARGAWGRREVAPRYNKGFRGVEEQSSSFCVETPHCWIVTTIDYAAKGNIWEA